MQLEILGGLAVVVVCGWLLVPKQIQLRVHRKNKTA